MEKLCGAGVPLLEGGPPPFFVDTSPSLWCETLKSIDVSGTYSKRLRTMNPESRKKRFNSLSISDDVIVLDEVAPVIKQRRLSDDSVIFVGETNPSAYIPLENPRKQRLVRSPLTPNHNKAFSNTLFTLSEKRELNAYNDNAYNPSGGENKPQTGKRMIIIDGSNVAFRHSLSKEFSVKGLKICIDYFAIMGHEVKAVVPLFRMHKCSDPQELQKLHDAGKIVATPCKNMLGKSLTSYDDRFVLQLACELDAAVVSNDNYLDLIHENSAFKKIIENRVIGYTWCNDIFILPKDPYGKFGPSLHSILNRV